MKTLTPPVLPARFDEFAQAVNEANVARLALEPAREDLQRAEAALQSARQRYNDRAAHVEILRREIFEHEAVAA